MPGSEPSSADYGPRWGLCGSLASFVGAAPRGAIHSTASTLLAYRAGAASGLRAAEALYAPGVDPVHRRNARANALGSEKLVRNATWVVEVPGTARCRIASSRRTSSNRTW